MHDQDSGPNDFRTTTSAMRNYHFRKKVDMTIFSNKVNLGGAVLPIIPVRSKQYPTGE